MAFDSEMIFNDVIMDENGLEGLVDVIINGILDKKSNYRVLVIKQTPKEVDHEVHFQTG